LHKSLPSIQIEAFYRVYNTRSQRGPCHSTMESASRHALYVPIPVCGATSQNTHYVSGGIAGAPRRQTHQTLRKSNRPQSTLAELSKSSENNTRSQRSDQSIISSESSHCNSSQRYCDTDPSSIGEYAHLEEVGPERHDPGESCSRTQLITPSFATRLWQSGLWSEQHEKYSTDEKLSSSSTSSKQSILLQGQSQETVCPPSPSPGRLQPEEFVWGALSAVEAFKTHPAHDYWTWDVKTQRWFHRYEDTGFIIHCPNELD
ncbi:hypothetical protein CI238_01763, partial [Colletotrichum incanum]